MRRPVIDPVAFQSPGHMIRILQIVGVLVILLAVLRFSLARRSHRIALRGGLTGLNVATGLLVGMAAAILLVSLVPAGPYDTAFDSRLGESGYAPLVEALLGILPLAGAAAGGLLGYISLGALWRRLLVNGSASSRAWLRRTEFILCVVSLTVMTHRLIG
jgi:hypothetical protein